MSGLKITKQDFLLLFLVGADQCASYQCVFVSPFCYLKWLSFGSAMVVWCAALCASAYVMQRVHKKLVVSASVCCSFVPFGKMLCKVGLARRLLCTLCHTLASFIVSAYAVRCRRALVHVRLPCFTRQWLTVFSVISVSWKKLHVSKLGLLDQHDRA